MTDAEKEAVIARAHTLAEEAFLAGSGPGGQNANKVATTVQLRVNAYALRLPQFAFRRLQNIAGSKLTDAGEILVTARSHRTQDANRGEAREKLEDLLTEAMTPPRRRARTRLNRVGKTQRLKAKKERGEIKARRGKVDW
ncbi:alternative ribosome rescue aminoacyl-tRNA hydrolase ArfB [Alteriqipengyuania flavescens]|uniref:alternative ribosome rescue aminoacyl-tRNA hydrolase ArfB n=1 Tax=Alteriqipengyuania flavescens TaxID=3053610 RepID=UPI0025B58CFB|nr:alternative ribosome rescue aminoacyl-tRNA hydrolase ArfB [Alteriqipengyuania flavescens]WJY19377.1 alternative ribosome rescue aminoacyl-tRNA hydrolase ArfB [Alteriqipengyuania flavescens]WJY25319.1 alternative ribosome rescue aminoacyl-tRNA hydrolase ArfB [Alteriqipengyuania flavescens]